MSPTPRLWLHALIKGGLLLGFAAYIAVLSRTGTLLLYITPLMAVFVKIAALGLVAVGGFQLQEAYRLYRGEAPSCDCEDEGHHHGPSRSLLVNVLVYGLFALPLLIGFLLPDGSAGNVIAP